MGGRREKKEERKRECKHTIFLPVSRRGPQPSTWKIFFPFSLSLLPPPSSHLITINRGGEERSKLCMGEEEGRGRGWGEVYGLKSRRRRRRRRKIALFDLNISTLTDGWKMVEKLTKKMTVVQQNSVISLTKPELYLHVCSWDKFCKKKCKQWSATVPVSKKK